MDPNTPLITHKKFEQSQLNFTYPKSAIETLEQGVKYVQS